MRITKITITDLAGFSGTVTFPLFGVTLITGEHGAGKSSLMRVSNYLFGRRPLADAGAVGIRHDPSILNGNAERGEAIVTLDDGTTLRVLVTQKDTSRQVKPPEGTKWNRATPEFMDSIVNALSYDPFTFIQLTEKQRVEVLLKASPVEVTEAEMVEAVGDALKLHIVAPSLEGINATYDGLYSLRRTANVAADVSGKHAAELEAGLPAEVVADDGGLVNLRTEKAAIEQGERDLIDSLRRAVDAQKSEDQAAHVQRKADIDKDINSKIAALEADRLSRTEQSQATATTSSETARNQALAALEEKRAAIQPELERLTAAIATAEERSTRAAQDKGTRDASAKARTSEAAALAESTRIDAAMQRLTVLKESVAAKLAVPGITIAAPREGQPVDICRSEKGALVPFSSWNTADQEAFCLRIAVLFHGKCGIVFVDEIGHFTQERRENLIVRAKEYARSGEMQFIMGSATQATAEDPTGGELRVVEG